MENTLLIILALGAAYYIYKKLFKTGGCNCGKDNCKTKKQG